MNSHEALHRFYAQLVTAKGEVSDARIVAAFASVKREQFVGPGPWHVQVGSGYTTTESDDPIVLYQDILIGLAPERGINNGEPSLHARCLGAANPKAGEVVVHVGAGTGYYTAILAHLIGPSGHVHAYEIEPDIAAQATENLAHLTTVTVHSLSGLQASLPYAALIYVSAGTTHVPAAWLDALALGGRLVLPVTPNERVGCMLLLTRRSEGAYAARIFSDAAFIPCVGARDEEQSCAVSAALNARTTDEVRSLRRSGEPDGTAWCVGKGWWLSTAEPQW
jgi:protein-L-isoaspartate(D-aspartate) O-methyltransferase